MNFKKKALFLVMLIVVFVLGVGYVFASPVLIKLYLEDQFDYHKARALNISAYHKFDNIFICEFEKSQLKALQDAGLSYQIIDEEPWTESYYVISESKRCEKVDLSRYGKILVQRDNFYFLKISDQNARSLAEKGYHIAKVFRRTIPLKYKPVAEELPKPLLYDPNIDSLVSLVSADSLYAWDLRLQNFQTRYSYSDSIHSARQWLFDKLVSFGIDSVWFHHYYWDSDQYNAVATVVGTASPDKVIVVGGHYDSACRADPYVWAPGADDNGSGTVATLEIARIIAENPLPVTVIFVPFAQEEQGLIGSYHFAEYLYNQGTDLHLMLNSDMIGHSVDPDTDVAIWTDPSAMDFVNIMFGMASVYTYLRPSYRGQHSGSDHYSFYQWGYDALFAQEGDFFYNGWHETCDIVDSLDFDYMKEVVKMELATLITVARTLADQGPWVLYHSHQVDDIGGNDNGAINPGDTVTMSITAKNYMTETAYSVNGTIRADDDFVDVTDSSKYFGDIDPGMTAVSSGDYSFQIDPSCPDSHRVTFELELTDGSSVWTSYLVEVVADTDFAITRTPAPPGVIRGDSTCFELIITSLGGFKSQVNLSHSELPPGVSGGLDQEQLIPTDTSILRMYAATEGFLGIYFINIIGIGGGIMREVKLGLIICLRGDTNADEHIDVVDVVYLINYLFKLGPPPMSTPQVGNVNCDDAVDVVDVVYLINYVFKGGPSPC